MNCKLLFFLLRPPSPSPPTPQSGCGEGGRGGERGWEGGSRPRPSSHLPRARGGEEGPRLDPVSPGLVTEEGRLGRARRSVGVGERREGAGGPRRPVPSSPSVRLPRPGLAAGEGDLGLLP